jgi:beta-galactosidase GanA
MRQLLRSEYFPFGSQYYRAPSPPPDDWARDLDSMKRLGFNTVKYWIQWRWNHPEPDRFYFDDIDRLMDLAGERDLKVMLNTILDVAPAWIYRDYPDASMVTLSGRNVGPQTQPHRQIGGLGICLHHEEVMDHLFRFLGEAIRRYSDHPALEIWNVGSEPELTQSMSEMRLWARDARAMGEMMDYNEHAQRAFRKWLARRYDGDLDRLNTAWNRNYRSFDEAEVPKTRNTFNDIVDWRMFFVDTLGDNLARRFEVAEKEDAGRHPVMCHHVFIQGFPLTSTASDPWNAGRFGDLHGITQMDDPMMCDVARCCARGRPVISAEMLMLMGYTLDLPKAIDADDIKRNVFTGIAANLKGFIFWQFRPEMLGREAPTWGLSHLDGSTTPWLDAFAEVGQVLQSNAGFLLDAAPRDAEVAVLYSPENQVFAWASTSDEFTATDAVLGAHAALYEHNHVVDLVHPREIGEGLLDRYKVLVVPFPYWLSEDIAERLRTWVEAGGTLIGEAFFGGWDVERGRHHTTLPGYGLHELFGVRQKNAVPAREHEFVSVQGVVRAIDGEALRSGLNEPSPSNGFVLAQNTDVSKGIGQVEMVLGRDLAYASAGQKAYGAIVREDFFVEGAEVLATYGDGEPAITRNSSGQGQAILVGSYLALPYRRHGYAGNAALLASLVELADLRERPRVIGGRVRVDVVSQGEDEHMIILQNLEVRAVEVSVEVPVSLSGEAAEQFGGEALQWERGASSRARVRLGPNEVRVYRV